VEAVEVLPFDQASARRFAAVAAALSRRGEPIGTFDTLMAARALSLGLTFVTNDLKQLPAGRGAEGGELDLSSAPLTSDAREAGGVSLRSGVDMEPVADMAAGGASIACTIDRCWPPRAEFRPAKGALRPIKASFLARPEFKADPCPFCARIRQEAPVFRVSAPFPGQSGCSLATATSPPR
jgi:hypothetical protein